MMEQKRIKSMTGYGQGNGELAGVQLAVEIRSVNHRFLETTIRLPPGWMSLEEEVKSILRRHLKRGKVTLSVMMEGEPAQGRSVEVDWELADGLIQAMRKLKERYALTGEVSVGELLQYPEVFKLKEAHLHLEEYRAPLMKIVTEAVEALLAMREKEGKVLALDLGARTEALQQLVAEIQQRAPQVVAQYRERLGERLRDFLASAALDEERIVAEAALFADRADIAEELTRLKSHLAQVLETLEQDDAVGRRLDFLIQEMNREVNTIGSKAQDGFISGRVVECKSQLEKMREQVQNIE